ncbi:MAG: SLC13 family permease [Cellulosilyticaceae bacterium]
MNAQRRLIYILTGPIVLLVSTFFLADLLTIPGAQAVGVLLWMIFWWITRPVDITITALIPVIANALLNIVPMSTITSQYASDSIILIFGSGLICLPWVSIGLDRRIALKALSLIGPSMNSQIVVWLLASVFMSTALPNVAVCALLTPIAVSMLSAAGYQDISKAAPAVPILLAIGWGVGLGGVGSPLGGAMNLAAISYLEEYTGQEFMYVDWVIRTFPFFLIAIIVLLVYMLLMPKEVKVLNGTKEYFQSSYLELGPMKKDEKICAVIFVLGTVLAFARPLYAEFLPALSPPYIFLILGTASFFLTDTNKKALLTWKRAEEGTMWGMMILFGGGLALGKLINDSGASLRIAEMISQMSLDGGFLTIVIFVVFARVISEVTNSTTSAAVTIPIVLGFTAKMGLNPIPYWFITVLAFNAEYILPISVRAIPVSYGLDANKMLKRGIPITIISTIVVIIFGYLAMQLWPTFSEITYRVQ